jgi:hypothetical protein
MTGADGNSNGQIGPVHLARGGTAGERYVLDGDAVLAVAAGDPQVDDDAAPLFGGVVARFLNLWVIIVR